MNNNPRTRGDFFYLKRTEYMINNIANQSSFPAATIDSQMLLKMVNEARRLRGEKEVRNNDFN